LTGAENIIIILYSVTESLSWLNYKNYITMQPTMNSSCYSYEVFGFPDYEDSTILRNFGTLLPECTVTHCRDSLLYVYRHENTRNSNITMHVILCVAKLKGRDHLRAVGVRRRKTVKLVGKCGLESSGSLASGHGPMQTKTKSYKVVQI